MNFMKRLRPNETLYLADGQIVVNRGSRVAHLYVADATERKAPEKTRKSQEPHGGGENEELCRQGTSRS